MGSWGVSQQGQTLDYYRHPGAMPTSGLFVAVTPKGSRALLAESYLLSGQHLPARDL